MSNANYLLAIAGLEGNSTQRGFEKQFLLDSFNLGVTLSVANVGGSGAGVGKSTQQPFQFTTKIGPSSPLFLQACANGKHFASAILSVVTIGENPTLLMKYTLTGVFVSAYQMTGQQTSDAGLLDHVSLTFSQAQLDYQTQTITGAVGATVTAGIDLKTARRI